MNFEEWLKENSKTMICLITCYIIVFFVILYVDIIYLYILCIATIVGLVYTLIRIIMVKLQIRKQKKRGKIK